MTQSVEFKSGLLGAIFSAQGWRHSHAAGTVYAGVSSSVRWRDVLLQISGERTFTVMSPNATTNVTLSPALTNTTLFVKEI